MTEEYPHSKAELLDNLAQGWQTLNAFIQRYSDTQLTQIKDQGGWTAKDHLAHLIRWSAGILAFLDKKPRWEGMGIDRKTWDADFEAINAAMQAQDKDHPLADVLTGLRSMHDQVTAKITALPEADLFKSYTFFQPFEADDPTDQRPAVNWIAGNTYQHYAEHMPWIETLIAAQPSS
jgi:hypothetical protein